MKIHCILLFFLFSVFFASAQKSNDSKQVEVACFAFYNLENLFDTIVDPDTTKILQEDFTPFGKKNWNSKKYFQKLNNLAEVISKLGVSSANPIGPAVLGVCEIENKAVLEDLVKNEKIANRKYNIVHHEGPDRRGIDCAMLYNPDYFSVETSSSYALKMPNDSSFASRDQLLVTGNFLGERMHFLVLHWPSRRGGEKKSRPKRIQAAKLSKKIIDSIQSFEKNAKIILMGDLNDDPVSRSVKDFLKAVGDISSISENNLFNCMYEKYKKGIGSLAYRDNWNLFDQFIVSPPLISIGDDYSTFKFLSSTVYNKSYLKQKEGNFSGYPFRTYVGSNFMGGYSDHFPVYIYLVKEKNNDE